DEITTTLRRKTESFSHSIKIRGVEPRTATDHACIAIRRSRLIRAVRRIVANVNIITPLSDIPRYVVNSPRVRLKTPHGREKHVAIVKRNRTIPIAESFGG